MRRGGRSIPVGFRLLRMALLTPVLSFMLTWLTTSKMIRRASHAAQTNRLGVGGLDDEIKELYRRAFQSRGLPSTTLKGLGIKHTKGVLLYGPPGSGE